MTRASSMPSSPGIEMSENTTSMSPASSERSASAPLDAVTTSAILSSWRNSELSSSRGGASWSSARACRVAPVEPAVASCGRRCSGSPGGAPAMGERLRRRVDAGGVLGHPENHLGAGPGSGLHDQAEVVAVDLPEAGVHVAEPDVVAVRVAVEDGADGLGVRPHPVVLDRDDGLGPLVAG